MLGTLSQSLPSTWTFLDRPECGTTILLHESGLWFEADTWSLLALDRDQGQAVEFALARAVLEGRTGRVVVALAREVVGEVVKYSAVASPPPVFPTGGRVEGKGRFVPDGHTLRFVPDEEG